VNYAPGGMVTLPLTWFFCNTWGEGADVPKPWDFLGGIIIEIENCNQHFLHSMYSKHFFRAFAGFLLILLWPTLLLHLHCSIEMYTTSAFSNVTNICRCELLRHLLFQGKNVCLPILICFCINIRTWL